MSDAKFQDMGQFDAAKVLKTLKIRKSEDTFICELSSQEIAACLSQFIGEAAGLSGRYETETVLTIDRSTGKSVITATVCGMRGALT